MNRPDELIKYKDVDLKLGIKSSLPKVKSTLALAILFYESNDQLAEFQYSTSQGERIIVNNDLKNKIMAKVGLILEKYDIAKEKLIENINSNLLFTSQLEPLIVAFELIWKIAEIDFIDEKPTSAERTGGARFEKKLLYTINIDIIHLVLKNNEEQYLKVLLSWLDIQIPISKGYEEILISMLSILSEGSIYKLSEGNQDIIFNQNSIYKKLVETNQAVSIKSDKEAKGSLRILNSFLTEGLNPHVAYQNWKIQAISGKQLELLNYQKRVDAYLRLSALKVNTVIENENENYSKIRWNSGYKQPNYKNKKTPYSHNRIIFGAPGTGKSYTLNLESVGNELSNDDSLLKNGGEYERVTFHPDYSYSNFVGTYKPVPITNDDGEKIITYKYVPGPFMRILVKALKNNGTDDVKPYLLVIEEINRANIAAVFGDVFQLLDRKNNVSEYPIQASEDIKKYLSDELGGNISEFDQIRIPDNMFIWATMNSADQGVFPMDTAFKRRWDFTYRGIDEGESNINNYDFFLGTNKDKINWNLLRKAINNELLLHNVNEDKLLGPHFISKDSLKDNETFINVFKNKVIMYLFDDAAKQKRGSIFSGTKNPKLYSYICKEFDKKGVAIFSEGISKNFITNQIGDDE